MSPAEPGNEWNHERTNGLAQVRNYISVSRESTGRIALDHAAGLSDRLRRTQLARMPANATLIDQDAGSGTANSITSPVV
jgi:hypothetical protein